MQLEQLTAEVRPRGRWEAVDLGFAMVRRHFPRLLAAWLLCIGPLWALILWGSQWLGIGWAIIAIWWLKPLCDRVPLFVLSRALFGPPPSLGETLRAWPKLLVPNWWHSLVTTRLSGTRSLLLPVSMLEGLRGADRKRRATVLIRHSGGCASSLAFVSALYEGILAIGIAMLIMMFVPDDGSMEWVDLAIEGSFTRGVPSALLWTALGCWLVAITLVELFYVGGGFGLYLNARTHLEGWDVELAFRKLGRRLAGAAAALALLVFGSAQAQAVDLERTEEQQEAAGEIAEILKHEDFKVKKITTWEAKDRTSRPDFSGAGSVFQVLGYILFWAAVAVALYFLAHYLARHWRSLRGLERSPEKATVTAARSVAGLDVTPESLPDDVVAAARARWQAGDASGALSLLYRGALSWLVHRLELPIRDSDTEGDCLRRAAEISEANSRDYFTRLTGSWVGAAYAGHAPRPEEMDALLNNWPYRGGKTGTTR